MIRFQYRNAALAAILALVLFVADASAATRRYIMVGSSVKNADTAATFTTLTGSTSAAAMHASSDNWASGDEIILDPTGGAFPVSPSVSWPSGIVVHYRGATITAAPSSSAEATFYCTAPSIHLGPMFIRNTHSTEGRAIYIGTSSAHLRGFYMSDVTVLQCANNSGYSPISIQQDKTNQYIIDGEIDNLTMELTTAGGYRDLVGFGDAGSGWTNPGIRGHFVLVNPRLGYATSTGGSGGGTSNNLISQDSYMDVHVFGGVLHDSGGRLVETVNHARLYLYGVQGYNSSLNASAYGTNVGAVYATGVSGCKFWNVGHGIIVGPPDLSTNGFGADDDYFIEDTEITRHPTLHAGTEATNIYAFENRARLCRISNCSAFGYGISGNTYYNGFFLNSKSSGADMNITIEDSYCDNAYRVVDSSSKECTLIFRHNVFRQAPANNTLDPYTMRITGAGGSNRAKVIFDSNLFDSRPASATNPEPMLSGTDGTTVTIVSMGNNYQYSNGNHTGANTASVTNHALGRQQLGVQTSQKNNQVKVSGLSGKATATDGYVGAIVIIENQNDATDIQLRHVIDHEVVASVYASADTVVVNRPWDRVPAQGDWITIVGCNRNMHMGANDVIAYGAYGVPTYTADGLNAPGSPVVLHSRNRVVARRTDADRYGSWGKDRMIEYMGSPGLPRPKPVKSMPGDRMPGG